MRIAFDVKGTIEGPHKAKILRLFHALQARGHELIVWSNLFSYAVDAVKDNNLKAEYMSKRTIGDCETEADAFDYCIEDDISQWWLASRRFIWVHEVPDDIETFVNDIENLRVGHRGEGV